MFLGELLPNDAEPAGTDRLADGNLAPPCRCPGEQEVSGIGAGEQEDQPDGAHQ